MKQGKSIRAQMDLCGDTQQAHKHAKCVADCGRLEILIRPDCKTDETKDVRKDAGKALTCKEDCDVFAGKFRVFTKNTALDDSGKSSANNKNKED